MHTPIEKVRNIAIIAHVDHGKTTLVDGLLRQSGTVAAHKRMAERAMDSNDLERERGITILSKCTTVTYKDHKINIVDTPGHADFGGEVERVLKMVDSVLLLVDAFEGPMPQTRFVLNKSLQLGHRPIVVINKIDRPDSRPETVLDLAFDLFGALDADDDQLDFPVVYASAKEGYAVSELEDLEGLTPENRNLVPLFETIIDKVPRPPGDADAPLRMQVSTLSYNDYLGRLAIGRVFDGKVQPGQNITLCRADGSEERFKVTKLFSFQGLEQIGIDEARAGDICAVAGIGDVLPGETICDVTNPNPMPLIKVDEPTVSMTFAVNNGPFAGQSGKFVTSRQIIARLRREMEQNVSMRVEETQSADAFKVSGRGELHLSILIETMRREGYEICVSRPQVIVREIDGEMMEPIESLIVDVDEEYSGTVINKLNQRKGDMQAMSVSPQGTARLEYMIPTRGLIGFRNDFLTDTRGTGVMYHNFDHYGPFRGETPGRQNGAMIAMEQGETTAYALYNLQERGQLLVGPGQPVYGGMLIGIHSRENDIVVNPNKRKHLTNVRASGSDDAMRLTPPLDLSLERALELIDEDEMVEITPGGLRLRKFYLDHNVRKRETKRKT